MRDWPGACIERLLASSEPVTVLVLSRLSESAECLQRPTLPSAAFHARQSKLGADMLTMDAAGDEYRYEISSACILVLTRCVLLVSFHGRDCQSVGDRSGPVRSGPVRSGPVW